MQRKTGKWQRGVMLTGGAASVDVFAGFLAVFAVAVRSFLLERI